MFLWGGRRIPVPRGWPQHPCHYGVAAVSLSLRGAHGVPVPAEYVNIQEPAMDMRSITDRAAQTLLWTELFRGAS